MFPRSKEVAIVNGLLQRHAVVGILDEIQRRPDLYRALRVLVDRPDPLS